MLRIGFVTLFPEMVLPALSHSIIQRAVEAKRVTFQAANPRDFAEDRHRTVDDSPYGGGPGMVLKPEPVSRALASIQPADDAVVILTDPSGTRFAQEDAHDLATKDDIVFICGHYGGVDHRIREQFANRTYSIGDFILTGGELPALMMADAVVRLLPGVLGDAESLQEDALSDGLLGHPQYTRPETFEGVSVPEILKSGNHQAVAKWRRSQSLQATRRNRPDLFYRAPLTKADIHLL